MTNARALGSGERLLYNLVTDFPDGPEVSHWVDEARVQSGDSVTVLSTFYRDHLARVDVVYPTKVALRDGCPLCAALRQAHGPPSEESMSTLGPSMRWAQWPCCELRLAHAGLAVTVSYVDRRIAAARVEAAQQTQARAGEQLLR